MNEIKIYLFFVNTYLYIFSNSTGKLIYSTEVNLFYVNKAHQRKICIFCLISISMKKVSSVGKNQFIFFFSLKTKSRLSKFVALSVLNVLDFLSQKDKRIKDKFIFSGIVECA